MASAKPSNPDAAASEDESLNPTSFNMKEISREEIPPVPGRRFDGVYERVEEEFHLPQLKGKGPLVRTRGVRVGDLPARGSK